MEDIRKEVDKQINNLLSKCTVEQVSFFHKLYPSGIGSQPWEKLPVIIRQIERTLKKNIK